MIGFGKEQAMALESELWIAEKLTKKNYEISIPADFRAPCCDILIHKPDNQYKLCVEVKYSKQGSMKRTLKDGSVTYYPRWQWNVSEVDTKDRVLILIAEDKYQRRYCFIMPGHVMAERTHFQINSHPSNYKGFMSQFLERWDTIDVLLNKAYVDPRQMLIFEGALCSR